MRKRVVSASTDSPWHHSAQGGETHSIRRLRQVGQITQFFGSEITETPLRSTSSLNTMTACPFHEAWHTPTGLVRRVISSTNSPAGILITALASSQKATTGRRSE